MGKRSDFERRPMDFYATPEAAVLPLLPYLPRQTRFCEPCAGGGDLIRHLEKHGHQCASAFDLNPESAHPELDALQLASEHLAGADMIITNPPWSRQILHPMIWRFANLAPTWLLFDADWMHTRQSSAYMDICAKIVSVGRVKWIADSDGAGKDNCCWYLFDATHKGPTEFWGRSNV